ncbi:MAG: YciI family protein [Promethearchaeota archaeon]
MTEEQHFYAVIKPYRQDFLTTPKAEEEKIMSDHFHYLKSLLNQKKLFFAGPTLIPEDPFGIIILEVKSEEEAKKLLENDPSIRLGIQKIVDFRPIRLSLTRKYD